MAVILASFSRLIVVHRPVPSEITVLTVAWIRRHDRIVGADQVSNRDTTGWPARRGARRLKTPISGNTSISPHTSNALPGGATALREPSSSRRHSRRQGRPATLGTRESRRRDMSTRPPSGCCRCRLLDRTKGSSHYLDRCLTASSGCGVSSDFGLPRISSFPSASTTREGVSTLGSIAVLLSRPAVRRKSYSNLAMRLLC